MPAKIDGTNGVLQAYDYQTPTTGFSYTFAAGTQVLVMNPAGTLATGTITMPASPADGMVVTIESTQQITASTVQGNTGQSLVGAPAQIVPNQPRSYVYRLSNTTWYPLSGGVGASTVLVSGTAQNSTSGTSIDFTGIPSWVKRVTVMFNSVSTNGTSLYRVQLGAGSIQTTGYSGATVAAVSTGTGGNNFTGNAGFEIRKQATAADNTNGQFVFCLLSGALWSACGTFTDSSDNRLIITTGIVTLTGALDRVRITTVNGTDTFDAGSINILYE